MIDTAAWLGEAPVAAKRTQAVQPTRWTSWDARLGIPGPTHVRHDRPNGAKDVVWLAPDGQSGLGGHRLEDLIYADQVPLPAYVVVTEGERACDAVRVAGLPAVATVCGAGATPGPSVVALFAGVDVALWPDADAVGFDHMARLARKLEPIVASLALIEAPADVPEHWDAADATELQIRLLAVLSRDIWLNRPADVG